MMFKFKKQGMYVIAPVTGHCVESDKYKNSEFSNKIEGKMVIIEPVEGTFRSPVDGEIIGISENEHLFGIRTKDGLDVLVHIGVDTIKVELEAFVTKVKLYNEVKSGDVICKVDFDLLRKNGYKLITLVSIIDNDLIRKYEAIHGDMIGGADVIMEYSMR